MKEYSEKAVLTKLKHENIVQMYDYILKGDEVFVIMELCEVILWIDANIFIKRCLLLKKKFALKD